MKSTTLNSALFTDLDDAQSEAVNGGSYHCYYEKPKYYCYEKPKYYCYEKPKYYCKPKSYC
jgi:hypothetical protein